MSHPCESWDFKNKIISSTSRNYESTTKTTFSKTPTGKLRIPSLFCFWTKSLQTNVLGYIILKFKCLSHFRSWWRHFENFRKKKWISTLGGVLDIFFSAETLIFLINIENASKLCIPWPKWTIFNKIGHFDHKNDHMTIDCIHVVKFRLFWHIHNKHIMRFKTICNITCIH